MAVPWAAATIESIVNDRLADPPAELVLPYDAFDPFLDIDEVSPSFLLPGVLVPSSGTTWFLDEPQPMVPYERRRKKAPRAGTSPMRELSGPTHTGLLLRRLRWNHVHNPFLPKCA